jgi:hypothetical protein
VNSILKVIIIIIVAGAIIFLSYSWGHRDATVEGLDRKLSSVYANAFLEVSLLELLQENEIERVMEALFMAADSDLLYLEKVYILRGEVTVPSQIRYLLSGALDGLFTDKPDWDEISLLRKRFSRLDHE